MAVGMDRRRRPSPIFIPKLDERQVEAELATRPKTSPLLTEPIFVAPSTSLRPTGASPTQRTLATQPSVATARPVLSTSRTTAPQQSRPTLRTLATTTTNAPSPTKTTFVTIIQSIKSPVEKAETPDSKQTVFISANPVIVTVTVPAGVSTGAPAGAPVPTADTALPSKAQSQGAGALPQGAKIPVIVLAVVAGMAMFFTIAVIIWRRKKRRRQEEEASAEQRAIDEGGFRAIPDKQPILR